ncbi:MAG: hypothetical protein KAU94_13415, partial [Verrucomicrobia bacterium]|nr:hypothetical protein [Verrucomicrobiota bacterium]
MNLNQTQLEAAVAHGLILFNGLKKDYPELRLYPVFCRFGPGSGQCELTTDPLIILTEFPEMLVVSKGVEDLGQR